MYSVSRCWIMLPPYLICRASWILACGAKAVVTSPNIEVGLAIEDLALSEAKKFWTAAIDPQLVEIAFADPQIRRRLFRGKEGLVFLLGGFEAHRVLEVVRFDEAFGRRLLHFGYSELALPAQRLTTN